MPTDFSSADAAQSRQAGFVRYCLNFSPHKKSIPGGCSFCVLVYFSATICFRTCLLWSACWGPAVPFYLLGVLFLFCVLLWSACWGHAVPFYRMLGETTQGKGGSPAAIPLPLPGFLPQSPAFLLPHPPLAYTHRLHTSMMLHKTLRDEIYFMKSWGRFSTSVFHKSGEGCGKESARENR